MHVLLLGLKDRLRGQARQRAHPRGLGRHEMVDLVFVKADGSHKVDLHPIASCNAANEIAAGLSLGLRHRQDRLNVVTRVAVFGGKECVVHIEFAHRSAVRTRSPLGADAPARRHAEDRGVAFARMPKYHVASRNLRPAIDDQFGRITRRHGLVCGHAGYLPGELIIAPQLWFLTDILSRCAAACGLPSMIVFFTCRRFCGHAHTHHFSNAGLGATRNEVTL